MKSRLAILAMLVTGMLFSTAGVGLALSGRRHNASIAQYAECTPTPTPAPSSRRTPAAPQQGGVSGDVCEEGGVLPGRGEPAPQRRRHLPETEEGGVLPAAEEPRPSPSASRRPRPRRASCRSPASRRSPSCSAASRC